MSKAGSTALVVLAVTVFFCGLGVLLFKPIIGALMTMAMQGTSKPVPAGETSRLVAVSLMRWELFGEVPDRNPAYSTLEDSIRDGITPINGHTESDGFHGDGVDWFEVELSPELAARLRASLENHRSIRQDNPIPSRGSAPSWWPKSWPGDVRCYHHRHDYLMLPQTGTRAWFMRVRT